MGGGAKPGKKTLAKGKESIKAISRKGKKKKKV